MNRIDRKWINIEYEKNLDVIKTLELQFVKNNNLLEKYQTEQIKYYQNLHQIILIKIMDLMCEK